MCGSTRPFVIQVSTQLKVQFMSSSDSDNPSRETIEQEAVVWLARQMSGEMTAEEAIEFENWRQSSPRHTAASRKMQRLWQILPQALADNGATDDAANDTGANVIDFPLRRQSSQSRRRPILRTLSWSAGLAAAASLLWAVSLGYASNFLQHPLADYRTLVGEQRTLQLSDGSTLYLNTNTALDVAMAAGERRIELLQGEAEFEVAHDSRRPFRVVSGHTTTEAIGTRFVVRYADHAGTVTLLQGKVRASLAAQPGIESIPVVLHPGQQVAFDQDQLNDTTTVDPNNADAWRRRRLVMSFVTLDEVVAEINRYRPGHVWLTDPTLAQKRLHVSIDIQQIDDWLAALPNTLPIEVTHIPLGRQVLLQPVKPAR